MLRLASFVRPMRIACAREAVTIPVAADEGFAGPRLVVYASFDTVVLILKPAPRRCGFKPALKGLPDSKNTSVMLHWTVLVKSFPGLV